MSDSQDDLEEFVAHEWTTERGRRQTNCCGCILALWMAACAALACLALVR